MKVRFYITFITLLLLFSSALSAAELKNSAIVSGQDLEIFTGEKLLLNLTQYSVATDTGDVFCITTDKDNNIKWYTYSALEKKIEKKGTLPKNQYSDYYVSPTGRDVLIYAEGRSQLLHLDTDSSNLDQIYTNPQSGAGLAINNTPEANITFIDQNSAYTVWDKRNKRGKLVDRIVVKITLPNKIEDCYSLSKLKGNAMGKVESETTQKDGFSIGSAMLSPNGNVAYSITYDREMTIEGNVFLNSLFQATPTGKNRKVYEAEKKVLPLAFSNDGSLLLFGISSGRKGGLYIKKTGKIDKPLHGPSPLYGKIFSDGRVIAFTKNYATHELYFGPANRMDKVLTFARFYTPIFLEKIGKVAFLKDNAIVYYDL